MASLSVEEDNYLRMNLLLTGISPRAVRTFFNYEFAPAKLDTSLKKESKKLTELKRQHRINQSQWNLLFPKNDFPDSKTFDIVLMTTLLSNLTPMTPPRSGFDSLPSVMETTPAADLVRIKFYKNYLAHMEDVKIDISFFNAAWTDITGAIGRLGGQQMKQECDLLKTKHLGHTNPEVIKEDEINEMKKSLGSPTRSHIDMMISHKSLQEPTSEEKKPYKFFQEKVTKKMKIMMTSDKDTAPWNIRAINPAPMDVTCDGMHLDCFTDKRIDMKCVDFIKENPTLQELFEDKNSKVKPEYQIILSLITCQDKMLCDEKESLYLAVKNEMSMLCRWLFSNFSYDHNCLTSALLKSYEIGYNDVFKALLWKITKEFYRRYKQILKEKIVDMYPAYRCECQTSRDYERCLHVSKKLIVIECIEGNTIDIPHTFCNLKVSKFEYREKKESSKMPQSEMKAILKKMSDLSAPNSYSIFLPKLNGHDTSSLFQQHRNLSLICPSNMKSSGYSTQHTVVPSNACVQLFCHRKGIIPIGENHFPESVNGIPTDILQGQGIFASKTLRLGDKIGTTTHSGTLGGFYHHLGFRCFLTCAHVLLDMDVLKAPLGDNSHNRPVDVMIGNPQQICGRIFRRAFSSDDHNRTSIDAALVLIDSPNFDIDQNDIIQDNNSVGFPFNSLGLGTEFVNDNFCPKSILYSTTNSKVSMVAPGAFSKIDAKDLHLNNLGNVAANVNSVQNCPLIMAYPAHVRCSSGSFPNIRQYIMYNQISMNVSLQEGDSGTCIYITENASHNTGCIGMVHAVDSPSGISFVTPLEDIIQAMNRLS